MTSSNVKPEQKIEFGPVLSRIYSFFAARTGGHRRIYEKIVQDIVPLKPGSILEIGCGPGVASAMIARRLPEVKITCVDPSPTMIEIANRRFEKLSLGDRIRGVVGSSSNTSVAGKFDILFTSISFHHWREPDSDLVNLINKHLEKGMMIIYENLLKPNGGKSTHRHGLSEDYVKKLEISGTEKSYEVHDDLIVVKFIKK